MFNFRNGHFNLNDKIRSRRHSVVDNALICDSENNNPWVTFEEVTERVNDGNSKAYRPLKQFGYTWKSDTSEIEHEIFQSPTYFFSYFYIDFMCSRI